MTTCLFYRCEDDGTHVLARLEDGVFSGPDAELIERLLRERGYPENGKDSERLMHDSQLWAARVREDQATANNRPTRMDDTNGTSIA